MSGPEVFRERARVAVACGAALGESTLWDDRDGTLFWVDIGGGALWSWRPGHGDAVSRLVGGLPTFLALTDSPGTLLMGLGPDVVRVELSGGEPAVLLTPEPGTASLRTNDGAAAPDGSLVFGTMDDAEANPTGRFFQWRDGALSPFGERTVVTNGPAFDPARALMYRTDTTRGRVYRHAVEPGGGFGPEELFVRFEPGWGHPDGMTVDEDGHVWICHFGDGRVTRFSPDGEPVLIVPMPTAQVTKPAFGGPDLTTLFVASAARNRDRETDLLAGHLFAVETGIRGQPACRARLP